MIGFLVLDYCRREEGSLGLLYAADRPERGDDRALVRSGSFETLAPSQLSQLRIVMVARKPVQDDRPVAWQA